MKMVHVTDKTKTKASNIESAFIKADTYKNFILLEIDQTLTRLIPKTHVLKIKLEIDTKPPAESPTEVKTLLQPIPFQVRLFTLPVLFAGKLHAILCRPWKERVKGRDYFDFVWYVARGVSPDLNDLTKRMRQTGHLNKTKTLTRQKLNEFLKEKFIKTNFTQAKIDVLPFVKDPQSLALWSKEFFVELADKV